MMTQHIETKSLIESLIHFQAKVNGQTTLEELTTEFEKLAPKFLYGGYINVRNDYKGIKTKNTKTKLKTAEN